MLTAEFIDGCKVSDVDAIEAMGISLADVSAILLRFYILYELCYIVLEPDVSLRLALSI